MRALFLLALLACAPGNRLALEKSPYLLQHARNPVDWYPWGTAAFDRARSLDRPILLSIGYSTCHWCHVMERESFENREIAAFLNKHFVCVKVDREERPDVDAIYMEVSFQATGAGGWPLTILMDAGGRPFFAGTYFPPEEFKQLLAKAVELWKTDRAGLAAYGDALVAELVKPRDQSGPLGKKNLETAAQAIAAGFDPVHGGFDERAPKFPIPHRLSFLLSQNAVAPIRLTLDKMAAGGIFDQLGGGFHRYSTDREWLVPHFEKMLYDQALLVRAYVEARQVTGDERYASVARRTIEYVLRDLRNVAFYSAEDADSEGVEGKFYGWTPAEVRSVLGEESRAFCAYYDVTESGNFEGRSILSQPAYDPALERKFEAARVQLLSARACRPRPHRDEKILTDWNGLMIGALALAAGALREPSYARAATEAAEFVLSRLVRPDGRLLHCETVPGFVDDYAFFVWGLLDLYEATLEPRWLLEALRLSEAMIELFWDEKEGGLFFTGKDAEALIARRKECYDGAVPSGNSVAARNLLRLGRMLRRPELSQKGEAILRAFGGFVERKGPQAAQMLQALDFSVGPAVEVVLAGDARSMHSALLALYGPRRVIVHRSETLEERFPWLKEFPPLDGRPTAYVGGRPPTTSVENMLEAARSGDSDSRK